MANQVVTVLQQAVGISKQLVKTLASVVNPFTKISSAGKALNKSLFSLIKTTKSVGKAFAKFGKVGAKLTGLTTAMKTLEVTSRLLGKTILGGPLKALKKLANSDVNLAGGLSSLFPIVGQTRAAFELLKGTVLSFKNGTLDAFMQIEKGVRQAATTISTNVRVIDTATGEAVQGAVAEIEALGPKILQVQKNLVAAAPNLVGVTTKDLLDVFNQVSIGFKNISGQMTELQAQELGLDVFDSEGLVDDFKVAEELTKNLASAMKVVGLTARDVAQETRAILTGDIDMNARLAKQLGITRAQIEQKRAEGKLAGFLLEKTKEIGDANELYNDSLENTFSVITDVAQGMGRIVGGEIFKVLEKELLGFREKLAENRAAFDDLAEQLGGVLGPVIESVIDMLNDMVDVYIENKDTIDEFIIGMADNLAGVVKVAAQLGSTLVKIVGAFAGLKQNIKDFADSLDEKIIDKLKAVAGAVGGLQGAAAMEVLTRQFEEVSGGADKALKGVLDLKKEFGRDNAIDGFTQVIGNLSRNTFGLLPGLKKAKEGVEIFQEGFKTGMEDVIKFADKAQEKVSEVAAKLAEAETGGDPEQVAELEKQLVKVASAYDDIISQAVEQADEMKKTLDEQGAGIGNANKLLRDQAQERLNNLQIAKASALAEIDQLAKIENAEGEILVEILEKNKAIAETGKLSDGTAASVREIKDAEREAAIAARDLLEEAKGISNQFKVAGDLAADQGDSFLVFTTQAEAAIRTLVTTGATSQEVFKNLKRSVEGISNSLKFGGEIKNINTFYSELVTTLRKLEGPERAKAMGELLKMEKEIFDARKSTFDLADKEVKLREALGQISTEEAKFQQNQVNVAKQKNQLLQTERQITLQRGAQSAKTFEQEMNILASLDKAKGKEAERLQLKLENLRASEKLNGTELEKLKNKKEIIQTETEILTAAQALLETEARIAEVLRIQSDLRSNQDVRQAQEKLDIEVSIDEGVILEPQRKLLELQNSIRDTAEQVNEAQRVRLTLQEEQRRLQEQGAQISLADQAKLTKQLNNSIKEEFNLRAQLKVQTRELGVAQIQEQTRVLELERSRLDLTQDVEEKRVEVSEKIRENLEASMDFTHTMKSDIIEMEKAAANLKISEIDVKINAAKTVNDLEKQISEIKPEFRNGPVFSELKSALGELKGELGDLIDDDPNDAILAEIEMLKQQQQLRQKIIQMETQQQVDQLQSQIEMAQLEKASLSDQDQLLILKAQELDLETRIAQLKINSQLASGQIDSGEAQKRLAILGESANMEKKIRSEVKKRNKEEKKNLDAKIQLLRKQKDEAVAAGKTKSEIAKIEGAIKRATVASRALTQETKKQGEEAKKAAKAYQRMGDVSKSGGSFATSFEDIVGRAQNESFKKAKEIVGDWDAVFKRGSAEFKKTIDFSMRRNTGGSRGLGAIQESIENSNGLVRSGVDAVIKAARKQESAARGADRRAAQQAALEQAQSDHLQAIADQEAEAQRIADARKQLLEQIREEVRQQRIEAARARVDDLNQTKEFLDELRDIIVEPDNVVTQLDVLAGGDRIQDLISQLSPDQDSPADVTQQVEQQQNLAELSALFGEDVAKQMMKLVDIDKQIIKELKEGNVKSDDLTESNKIFIDPQTGELIVTGADPDLEKLNQLVELQNMTQLQNESNNILTNIEGLLGSGGGNINSIEQAKQFIKAAQDSGFVTEEDGGVVVRNAFGDIVQAMDLTNTSNEGFIHSANKILQAVRQSISDFNRGDFKDERVITDIEDKRVQGNITALAANTGSIEKLRKAIEAERQLPAAELAVKRAEKAAEEAKLAERAKSAQVTTESLKNVIKNELDKVGLTADGKLKGVNSKTGLINNKAPAPKPAPKPKNIGFKPTKSSITLRPPKVKTPTISSRSSSAPKGSTTSFSSSLNLKRIAPPKGVHGIGSGFVTPGGSRIFGGELDSSNYIYQDGKGGTFDIEGKKTSISNYNYFASGGGGQAMATRQGF